MKTKIKRWDQTILQKNSTDSILPHSLQVFPCLWNWKHKWLYYTSWMGCRYKLGAPNLLVQIMDTKVPELPIYSTERDRCLNNSKPSEFSYWIQITANSSLVLSNLNTSHLKNESSSNPNSHWIMSDIVNKWTDILLRKGPQPAWITKMCFWTTSSYNSFPYS